MQDNEENRKKFSEIMWGIADIFGGEMSKVGLKLRFIALSEYSIKDITAAGAYLLRYRKAKFPAIPTVAEFVEVIEKNIGISAKAEEQADVVLEFRHPPKFEDEITKHLMIFRWSYSTWSRSILEKDITWWRKDFVKAYIKIAEHKKFIAIKESLDLIGYDDLKRLEEE